MADKPAKTTKRLVKNPETFRERATKAVEEGDKPGKKSKLKKAFRPIGKLIRAIFRPIGRLFAPIGRIKIVRKVGKFLSKYLLIDYFRSSWKELKLVKWPNWQQSRKLTLAVIIFAVIFGALVAVLDYGLDKLFRNILLK